MAGQNKVAVAYKVMIYNNAGDVIGFAQSLKPSQSRSTKVVRQLQGRDVYGLEGVVQIPQPPEYKLTITRVALYTQDMMSSLTGVDGGYSSIIEQMDTFRVRRYRLDLHGNYRVCTEWRGCMITDYDMGSDDIGGAEIVESCSVTALAMRTVYGSYKSLNGFDSSLVVAFKSFDEEPSVAVDASIGIKLKL